MINTCNCFLQGIALSCAGFKTAEPVDPAIFKLIDNGLCAVLPNKFLKPHDTVKFAYAWDPPFFMFPRRVISVCWSKWSVSFYLTTFYLCHSKKFVIIEFWIRSNKYLNVQNVFKLVLASGLFHMQLSVDLHFSSVVILQMAYCLSFTARKCCLSTQKKEKVLLIFVKLNLRVLPLKLQATLPYNSRISKLAGYNLDLNLK